MAGERTFIETLRSAIQELIDQEVRALRLGRIDTPLCVREEITYSIVESKGWIVKLTETMTPEERTVLIKRMLRKAVDEEIDQIIQMRMNRCLRCLHMRYYDQMGTPHMDLPVGRRHARTIGCVRERPALENECRGFAERLRTIPLEDSVNKMALLYELRETLNRIRRIWEDYLIA